MKEWLMIAIMGLGGILFAAGGTDIPGIGGQKWLRRFLLPALWCWLMILGGVVVWKAAMCSILFMVVFHLGYGDRTSWAKKAMVFVGYGACSLVIGFSIWATIVPVVCLLAFFLSNVSSALFKKAFVWKVCEFIFGAVCGISIAVLI